MKRGQVWVETVIYTLIALTMIGLVLSFARPKLMEFQDRAILEQSISMMKDINNILLDLSQGGSGNKRKVELGISKGSLLVDASTNKIIFKMEDSSYAYSDPEVTNPIGHGSVNIQTEQINDLYTVTMTLDYDETYDLKYDGNDETKTLSAASVPYLVYITNEGVPEGATHTNMNFELS